MITDDGRALCTKVADACAAVGTSVLDRFGQDQVRTLRRMLFAIIGDVEDRDRACDDQRRPERAFLRARRSTANPRCAVGRRYEPHRHDHR